MRRVSSIVCLCILIIFFTGCEGEDGRIKVPHSARQYKSMNYQDAVSELENAGFTNIKTEAIEDLITGWINSDGEIENIIIDGNDSFSASSKYDSNVEIVVTYHTFPNDEKTEEPLEQDNDSEEVLTVDNCEELAEIMQPGYSYEKLTMFSDEYFGKFVEFDGNISYIANHNTSKYDYDVLIDYSNYEVDTVHGPTFKIERVNGKNFGSDNFMALPSFVYIGSNVKILAKIGSFNSDTGIFELYSATITNR